jgi:hypothetical protein
MEMTMTTTETTTEPMTKTAAEAMTIKVAAMSFDQRDARATEIADSGVFGPIEQLELAKLILGPDATVAAA